MTSRRGKIDDLTEEEKNIKIWRVKKLITQLEEARGNGTSMISLIIKPRTQVSAVSKMLAEEYGTASNIKSRVNRLSVLDAITSTQQRLKRFSRVPDHGLVIYCGTIMVGDNKSKKKTIAFEPYKPINTSLYLCDNRFHTEPLQELLESNDKFGFVILDGGGCLFGVLSGNTRTILHKFQVTLPKKHGRGGQSALRFARLRLEKRRNYLRKVAELAAKYFLSNDKSTVKGIVLAGSADFKSALSKSELFDQRLRKLVIKIVDIPYGGENGFVRAIALAEECLLNVKYIREKKIIESFFEEIARDTGKYVFGIKNTVQALEMGVIETLIVFENLDINRYVIKKSGEEDAVVFLSEKARHESSDFKNTDGSDCSYKEHHMLEWLADNYSTFGCHLELITDRSEQGAQFVKGFGGIGGVLRYKINFNSMQEDFEEFVDDSDSEDSDDDIDGFI